MFGDFDDYTLALLKALDFEEPLWRSSFEEDEVLDWLTERWPLPRALQQEPTIAARACIDDLEAELIEHFARSA